MTIILDSDELAGVTGYRTPKRQVAELHRQGFYRARIAAELAAEDQSTDAAASAARMEAHDIVG